MQCPHNKPFHPNLAVLAAQGHDQNAQRTIVAYGEIRTERFIGSLDR